jgi:hypothetical protein
MAILVHAAAGAMTVSLRAPRLAKALMIALLPVHCDAATAVSCRK